MFINFKIRYAFWVAFLLPICGIAQFYNSAVAASIDLSTNTEFIDITATAINKTEFEQSLRYELSIFEIDPESNRTKKEKTERFTLLPGEKTSLTRTSINAVGENKYIILLLIYDSEKKLLGKDRIVLNDSDGELTRTIIRDSTITVKESPPTFDGDVKRDNYGINLKGIVLEDTKTKPGRDFFREFSLLYNFYNINGERPVTVKEVLATGISTKLEIWAEDEKILEFFLSPRSAFIDKMALEAIKRVNIYFVKLRKKSVVESKY
jgi:hypothetical protein